MRHLALAGLVLAISVGSADVLVAQQGGQGRQRPRAEMQGRGNMPGPGAMLLRGIELSDQQKQQLKEIFEQNRPEQAERGGQMREEMRKARESGDTARIRQFREQAREHMDEQREQMVARREQMNTQIRSILTQEQRVQFDKNVATMRDRAQRGGRGGQGMRGERGPGRGR